jgi:hypothetical protein
MALGQLKGFSAGSSVKLGQLRAPASHYSVRSCAGAMQRLSAIPGSSCATGPGQKKLWLLETAAVQPMGKPQPPQSRPQRPWMAAAGLSGRSSDPPGLRPPG